MSGAFFSRSGVCEGCQERKARSDADNQPQHRYLDALRVVREPDERAREERTCAKRSRCNSRKPQQDDAE